jgi:hypothetical protein
MKCFIENVYLSVKYIATHFVTILGSFNPLKSNGEYMYFNDHQLSTFAQSVFIDVYIILRVNIDYISKQYQPVDFCIGEVLCLLCNNGCSLTL